MRECPEACADEDTGCYGGELLSCVGRRNEFGCGGEFEEAADGGGAETD